MNAPLATARIIAVFSLLLVGSMSCSTDSEPSIGYIGSEEFEEALTEFTLFAYQGAVEFDQNARLLSKTEYSELTIALERGVKTASELQSITSQLERLVPSVYAHPGDQHDRFELVAEAIREGSEAELEFIRGLVDNIAKKNHLVLPFGEGRQVVSRIATCDPVGTLWHLVGTVAASTGLGSLVATAAVCPVCGGIAFASIAALGIGTAAWNLINHCG